MEDGKKPGVSFMMVRNGYLARFTRGFMRGRRNFNTVWLVKYGSHNHGVIFTNSASITIPNEYVGKRIRFKVELCDSAPAPRSRLSSPLGVVMPTSKQIQQARRIIIQQHEKRIGA